MWRRRIKGSGRWDTDGIKKGGNEVRYGREREAWKTHVEYLLIN